MSNRPPQPTPDLPQEPRWDAFKSTTIESMSASEQSRDFIERSDLFAFFYLFTFYFCLLLSFTQGSRVPQDRHHRHHLRRRLPGHDDGQGRTLLHGRSNKF